MNKEKEEEILNNKNKYYDLMKIIRNGLPLNEFQLLYLKSLNKNQLLEIIEINNRNIDLLVKVINFTENKLKE